MHEQWEYKLLRGGGGLGHLFEKDGVNVVDHGPLSQETLNRLGKEGWEVCSDRVSFWGWHTLILKRKVASA
jgi:hypothetical protein